MYLVSGGLLYQCFETLKGSQNYTVVSNHIAHRQVHSLCARAEKLILIRIKAGVAAGRGVYLVTELDYISQLTLLFTERETNRRRGLAG